MSRHWVVRAEHVWKRYSRSMKNGVRYALTDSSRSFFNLAPSSQELRRDEFWSIRDLSFSLGQGEGLALIGRNGAGKSTMLKLLSGVIAPDRGEIRVRGRVVSLMMVGAGFHPMLTGRENIFIFGSILGMRRREIESRLDDIVEFAEIPEFLDTPVKYYSSGMYTRLAFSVAAQARPQVFIVDEVLAVGDVGFREKCVQHLLRMKSGGTALVIVSHSARHVRRLADRAIWLERGECRGDGSVDDVLDPYLAHFEALASGSPGIDAAGDRAAGQAPASAPPADGRDVATAAAERPGAPGAAAQPSAARPPPAPCRASLVAAPRRADGQIELRSSAASRITFRVAFDSACTEPAVVLELAAAQGGLVARSEIVLGSSSYPQPTAGDELTFSFDVTPHVTSGGYALSLQLVAGGARREPWLVGQWPCRVSGRDTGPPGVELLQAFTTSDASSTGGRPGDVALAGAGTCAVSVWGPRAEDTLVDSGDEVRSTLRVRGEASKLAWVLLDENGEVIAREPLSPQTRQGLDIAGTWRATLPSGEYREGLELVDGAGRSHCFRGARVRILEQAEMIGHVDLSARGALLALEDEPSRVTRGGNAAAVPTQAAISVTEVILTGNGEELNALVGRSPRFVAAVDAAVPIATPLQCGEQCQVVMRFSALTVLTDWDVALAFRRPGRGRCAGTRLHCVRCGNGAGDLEARFSFRVNLSPGQYLLGYSLSARDRDGSLVEVHEPDLASCAVIGPDSGGGDASLQFESVDEAPLAVAAGGPGESATAAGEATRSRFLGIAFDGARGADPARLDGGESAVVVIDALALRAIATPSFKLRVVDSLGRTVARLEGFDRTDPLASLAAGEARRYRIRFRPYLPGGRYRLQAALMCREGARAHVTDRCFDGPWFLVSRAGRPSGRALLETHLTVDLARTPHRASVVPEAVAELATH